MSATENTPLPKAQPPVKFTGLKLSAPKKYAAGVPALISTAKHIIEETEPGRGFKTLMRLNQKKGVDCPGCAWPDPDDHRSALGEYCENGAKAIAEELDKKRANAQFFKQNSVYELSLLSDYEIGKKGRLEEPMVLYKGEQYYTPISWDNAFELIGKELNKLNHPDEAVFYTSGRTSNEAAFLYQLFVRQFGTNNLPDCSNMCHESSGVALGETTGIGKGSVKLEDFYETELIIILGQNPGTNHPRMMSALEKGKRNGAKIIAINPLPEAGLMGFHNPQQVNGLLGKGTSLADLYLPVKINGDMALLKALESVLFEFEKKSPGNVFDQKFIAEKTVGFDAFCQQFKKYQLEDLARDSGIDESSIRQAAEMLAHNKRIIFCWGMGLTQQPNGVEMVREIVNILLLKGSIGKPGSGVCPVRGHSNVQGNRTMMINEEPTSAQLDRLKKVFGFEPPRKPGHDVVRTIKAMQDGTVNVFFSMGGNFLSATPDTTYTAQALRKLKLSVCVSTKLNRSHLVHGEEALILPTLSRSDLDLVNGEVQFISTESSMGIVQSSKGVLKPVSDKLMNETQIVCRLAMATLGSRSVVNWQRYHNSYDAVRDDIEKCIPGFENYNIRVREKNGFYLPNAAREGKFITEKYIDRAPFTLTSVPNNTLAPGEYLMATTRTHDQFNTTIYGYEDRYRGIKNERRVIFMNQQDIDEAGFVNGEKVDLFNYDDGIQRVAPLFIIVAYPIPKGNTVTYFPETNVLISINNVVKESNMPAAKYVRIKIKKHDPINLG